MSRTTLKDIAESLQLSVTTVSKALKGYSDVSAKTRRLVLEKVEELHYVPNPFAVNLRTNESKTIGVIIPEMVHQFFSGVLQGIIETAEEEGYFVITLQSNESFEREKRQLEFLTSKQVDGILISLANETLEYEHINEIILTGTPIVMFDKIAKILNCSKVVIDDRKAGYEATKHLIDIGCKKIAHFRGPLMAQNSIDRFLGYKQAILDAGMEFDKNLVFPCEQMSFEEGKLNAKKICETKTNVDGIFINTDIVAVGAIAQFREMGVRIPEDISIVGFSNWFVSSATSPSLTTVEQPSYEMGKKAFEVLLDELNLKKKKQKNIPQKVVMDTHLIIRNSTKPL